MNAYTLILCVLLTIAGYGEAQRFERQYGRTPWGLPPWTWALMLGLVWPIGLILLAVAERMGRGEAARAQAESAAPANTHLGAWNGAQWTSGSAERSTILPR